METTFRHDEAEHLFIASVDGRQGTILYNPAGDGVLDYASTYIPADLRRRGLGSQLARYALDWARDHGYKVIPSCWFVRELMDRDAEYAKLKA